MSVAGALRRAQPVTSVPGGVRAPARPRFPRRLPPTYSPLSLEALLSGAAALISGGGDAVGAAEWLLRAAYRADTVRLAGSGTQALTLALEIAAERAGGDPAVALPAYTCFDVASAAVGARSRVRLYDLDPETLAPDLDSLGSALNGGARAVVVTPLYGIPVDWDAVDTLADRYGALVIEDAAQGHGAAWRGRPLGSHGALSVLSFGRGKGWTGGRGGAVLARGAAADALRKRTLDAPGVGAGLTTLARGAALWLLARPRLFAFPAALPWLHVGETRYHDPEAPRAITGAAAALLVRTASLATAEADRRRAGAAALCALLPSSARQGAIAVPRGSTAGYLRFPLRLRGSLAAFADARRAAQLGAARGYPATLAELDALRPHLAEPGADATARWPGAAELVRDLVTLPTHSLIRTEELEELARLAGRDA